MLDLRTLDVTVLAEAGTVVELLHPGTRKPLLDDEGKPYFVEVRGFDSEKVRDLDTRFQNKRIEALRKNQDVGDVASYEAETVARLNAATIRWYLPPLNGVSLEYSHEHGKKVYGNPGFSWLVTQVLDAARDRSRLFTTGSTP